MYRFDFRNLILLQIRDIHSRRKLPIICGGTSYYIESILWKYLTSLQTSKDDEELLKSKKEVSKIREVILLTNSIGYIITDEIVQR